MILSNVVSFVISRLFKCIQMLSFILFSNSFLNIELKLNAVSEYLMFRLKQSKDLSKRVTSKKVNLYTNGKVIYVYKLLF